MATRFVFERKQHVALEQFDPAPLGPKEMRMRTISSLMSTGTENICFNQNYAPGTHWDQWVKHPFYPGYLCVGEITEVGSEVVGWKVGQRAATRKPHASVITNVESEYYPLPDGLGCADAGWFGLAFIGFFGARAAEYRIGDSITIVGAGPIGQMSVRWASALGCERVIVVDPVPWRLELASRGGATHTLALNVDEAPDAVIKIHGSLPRLAMDCTGHPGVFEKALALPGDKGRLVLLGDAGDPSQQRLTPDVVRRGIGIVGAHMNHVDDLWSYQTIFRYWAGLWGRGRFNLDGLISHTFRPDQCADAYRTANERRSETMGIAFDWS